MTETTGLIPDTVVSLAAIAGLLIVLARTGRSRGSTDIAPRFRGALGLVAFFLAVRLAYWNTDFGLFRFATYAAAAFVPLTALMLAEGLLRRHAPAWAKWFMLAGGLGLSIAAFSADATASAGFTYALLLFQLAGFLLVAGMVVTRDRASLSPTENRAIVRVSLSLLLILPLLVSDFQLVAAMPVRLSGLAILATCWLSLSLSQPRLSHRLYIRVFALYLAASALAAGGIGLHLDLGWTEALQAWAIVFGLLFAAAIARDGLHAHEEATQDAVLAGIGQTEASSLRAYLGELAHRGVLDNAIILNDRDLTGFDPEALSRSFRGSAALSRTRLPATPGDDTMAESQLRSLFERYGATHLFRISDTPFMLAAVRQPGISGDQVDRDLSAAFGLARLIGERDCLRAALATEEGVST